LASEKTVAKFTDRFKLSYERTEQMILPTPDFKPAWWCRGAHAQSIIGSLLKTSRVPLNRRRFETPDGDFLDLDFLESDGNKNSSRVLIVHGLEGSSKSPYVQNLLAEIARRRLRAVVLNMRMCSGEPNRLKQTYHSGKTEDLDFVVSALTENAPEEKLYLVGYSIGGNIVLKWLGEQGEKAARTIAGAAAVSVPYDLARSVERMDRGFNREVYTRLLMKRLQKKLAAKKKLFPDAIRYDHVEGYKTFAAFDNEVTAPLNGFKDADDYWRKSSCKSWLKSVKVPTLLIHAEDDPFFPGSLLPLDEIRASGFLKALISPSGGHIGFVSGRLPWERINWLERTILDFFAEKNAVAMESPLKRSNI